MQTNSRLRLAVTDVRCEARDVMVLELRSPEGGVLPAFTAGAHLEIYLGNGLIRHYSLCNNPAERDRYCIGVGLARDSRGGSSFVHQTLRVGSKLDVSAPRNNFPLELAAEECVFVAGGIGITPIMAMIRACEAVHKPWRLFYCARNRQRTAFYEDLRTMAPERVQFHFDDEQDGRLFDAVASLKDVPDTAHVYTCGPGPLMKAVEAATASRPQDRVHFEWFTAAAVDASADQPFTVVLKNSGTSYEVPAGRSILEVLEDNDAGVPYSCREGLCATCRTTVLAGEVDHRDSVLTAAEKASNREMMICVSRAKSKVLELEL
ncbi:vanillate O-demethylase ferredoxin subunit [Panacagrimonas perspica]|uniref:Vanillate O-demethylase ferredoxin subunit n=1 Tax=Panacagrimonas perspica TaxID=381431 RepID=A0A4R7P433_9GAMM|nr:PDR/VanB family oxidoreductase [Panacagrimonas perspica]TDU28543.1 vanillate O-demethylase ferredoxin subunit [Panacagrimonas perspica]